MTNKELHQKWSASQYYNCIKRPALNPFVESSICTALLFYSQKKGRDNFSCFFFAVVLYADLFTQF